MAEVTPGMEGMSTTPFNVTKTDVFNATQANSIPLPEGGIILGLSFTCLVIAFCGLLGNSIVIWFLGFRIPKNQFTVYILNLAIADFLFSVSVFVLLVYILCNIGFGPTISATDKINITTSMQLVNDFGLYAGIFLLMAVSTERCLCALYPIWFRYKRPKHQSAIVCILLWVLSCLVTGLERFICKNADYPKPGSEPCTVVYLFTSALFLVVIILMVLFSIILVITVQKMSEQCHPSRLYIAIIASVAVFLISAIPARILGFILHFKVSSVDHFQLAFFLIVSLCSSVNCAANPFIYFLVGSLRRWKFSGSFSAGFQKLFKDEEGI